MSAAETLTAALAQIAQLDVLMALAVGALGGVVIGAIPGVGPAVAIAILLPATFALEPLVGLTLLLGVYGASMYGGAVPAVLINTPGTAVNALTTYDGYPMTRQGQPERALAICYGASFVGGVISVLCLILLAPAIAKIAPLFGSREIFLAALLGLVLVVVSHRGQTCIAAALVGLGIFLDTIGLEAVLFSQRYTFGQTWLTSGFDLIVVVLGLFALSQAFVLLTGPASVDVLPAPKGRRLFGLREVARHPGTATTSAGFGVVMGIIPGVGEFLAQFFAYSTAQRRSRKPEKFGRGAPEGLIASEAANNAVPAAAMIPLLALGIPGEALTAMMLSVFYVHNVVPGPQLFQNQPDFVLGLYLCLLLLNVVALAFLAVSTRGLVKVVRVPPRLLGVVVLTLGFVGVYSLRNSMTDCLVAVAFGWLGYLLKRVEWPVVPIVLGMVLGDILEGRLRTSLARVKTPLDFIDRPISAILFILIVLVLVTHLWSLWRARRDVSPAA